MSFLRRLFLGKTDKKDFLYVTNFENVYASAIKKSIGFRKPLVLIDEDYNIVGKTKYYYHGIRKLKWNYGYIVLVDKAANNWLNEDKCLFNSKLEICYGNYGKIFFMDRYVILKPNDSAYTVLNTLEGTSPKTILKINEECELEKCTFFYNSIYINDGALVLDNGGYEAKVFIEATSEIKEISCKKLINPEKRLKYNKYSIRDSRYGYLDKNYNTIIEATYDWLGEVDEEGKVDYKRDGHFGKIDLNTGKEIS